MASDLFLGGATGLVLGILMLLGVSRLILPVTALVFGVTLMLSSLLTLRLNTLELEETEGAARFQKIAREALKVGSGAEFLLGLVAFVIGVLVLSAGLGGPVLGSLATFGILISGISGLISGTAVTARMMSLFHR